MEPATIKTSNNTHQKIVCGFDESNGGIFILVKNKTINSRLSRWSTIMILDVARLNHSIGQK